MSSVSVKEEVYHNSDGTNNSNDSEVPLSSPISPSAPTPLPMLERVHYFVINPRTQRPRKRFVFMVVFVVLFGILVAHKDDVMDLILSARNSGSKGVVIYILLFLCWSMLLFPHTPLEIAAGLIWAPMLKAVIIAWVAKVSGSCMCFFIGRTIGGRFVKERLGESESKYIKAIGIVLEKRRHFITALVSCAFIPAAIKNYGLGTLPVPFRVFLLYTALCGIPYAFANVMIGAAAEKLRLETAGDASIADDFIGDDDLIVVDAELSRDVDSVANTTAKQSELSLGLGIVVTVLTVVGLGFLGRFCKQELEVS